MAVYDLLEELQIPYQRLDHEVTPSIESCHEVDKILGIEICKNLFLCNRQKTDFYLLMMPGDKPFKTKELSPLYQYLQFEDKGKRCLGEISSGSTS